MLQLEVILPWSGHTCDEVAWYSAARFSANPAHHPAIKKKKVDQQIMVKGFFHKENKNNARVPVILLKI